MGTFLVRKFVKGYENTNDQKVRMAYGVLASIVGIICNLLLFAMKFAIGMVIGSISVTADAFNNLSDAGSSIIGFIGVKIAGRPADKEHPFGHGRYEYVAALVVSFLVLQVGVSCLKSSIGKVFNPDQVEFKPVLVGILVLSVFVKAWLGLFNRKLGRTINSSVMKATAADAFGDVLITSVTIISIVIGALTGLMVDGYMGVVVSVFVLLAGYNIAKDTLEPLIGEAVPWEMYERITKKVESYENIMGSHDLIVHSYGPGHTMATIHAEVLNEMSFEEAHELSDRIERDFLREENIFLVIHMDPIEANDEVVIKAKREITDIVGSLDDKASIHDFRLVNGEESINLIFDLLVPHEYSADKKQRIVKEIDRRALECDKRYRCIITLEHGYIRRS